MVYKNIRQTADGVRFISYNEITHDYMTLHSLISDYAESELF